MRSARAAVAFLLAAACGGDGGAGPATDRTLFAEPLAGTLNQRFFYLNYVDEQVGTEFRDYTCGPKTYNGHAGTDIALANFAVMDSGVGVRAGAAGTVVETHDGEFDRQKTWTSTAVANYVAIRHADGVTSRYLHLKQNSVVVSAGQNVQAGDIIGQVGSSGFSDLPHLHIELRDANGDVVDPWAGACGAAESRWSTQLPYQSAFSLYDAGLTNASLTLDLVKEPPAPVGVFSTTDPQVGMWVELFNAPPGTVVEFRLYQPDGAAFFTTSHTLPRFYGMSWWWAWHAIPGYLTTGRWRMQYRHNGVTLAERAFDVIDAIPQVSASVPRERSGSGGGGSTKPW